MSIEVVGVVGAGVMGTGLAQDLAQTHHRVILLDVSEEILARAQAEIRKGLRLQHLLSPASFPESDSEVLGRVVSSTDYDVLSDAQFVIENVTEKWEIKKKAHKQIDAVCRPSCVVATNTSAIPITRIASVSRDPSRVIGMHFMNPVPMSSMVEVIRGYHTSDDTLARAKELLASMDKESVIVRDFAGFVTNRVLMIMINEAIWLVQDHVAPPENVDRLFKSCFGHKMGPLETADLIGLDTILYSVEVLFDSFNDSKYRPSPLLKEMVAAGLYGRKSGRGFYAYDKDQQR